MIKQPILSYNDINGLLDGSPDFYAIKSEQRSLNIDSIDAIITTSPQVAASLLKQKLNFDTQRLKSCTLHKLKIHTFVDLYKYFKDNNLNSILLLECGIITKSNLQLAMCETKIIDMTKYMYDNDYVAWIGFSDGTLYEKNNSICLYFNLAEAEIEAAKVNGYLAKYTLVAITLNDILYEDRNYLIKNMSIPGYVIKTALLKSFIQKCLSFNETKRYLEKDLFVYSGSVFEQFEVFANQGMSTVFTEPDESLIQDLVQQQFPKNATFYELQRKDFVYPFIKTDFVFIDNRYHTSANIFLQAIVGETETQQYTSEEKTQRISDLFNANYLYILLSERTYSEEHHCGYPLIVGSPKGHVWIFDEYDKAYAFCEKHEMLMQNSIAPIGLLCSSVPGLDLHSTLSLLRHENILYVDINPNLSNRMIVSIDDMLQFQNKQIIPKKDIVRIDHDALLDKPFIFNDIILA